MVRKFLSYYLFFLIYDTSQVKALNEKVLLEGQAPFSRIKIPIHKSSNQFTNNFYGDTIIGDSCYQKHSSLDNRLNHSFIVTVNFLSGHCWGEFSKSKVLGISLEEHQEISEILYSALHEIDSLRQLTYKYNTLKCVLMNKIFTGIYACKKEMVNQHIEAIIWQKEKINTL